MQKVEARKFWSVHWKVRDGEIMNDRINLLSLFWDFVNPFFDPLPCTTNFALGKTQKNSKDVTKTGSRERGTGNGSLRTSCQQKPPQKSKMAVQKTRERKKKTKKGIRALVEIRWGRNCKSDSHFTFTFWAGGMFFRYSTCFIYNMIRS